MIDILIMVINLRMYYIFNVKDDIANLYKNNPSSLYKILESIYYMHKEEVDYGFNIFKQITNRIRVREFNNNLYIKMHKDLVYSKTDAEHVINDLYHDEVSILKVKSSHLLLESNKSYSSFFPLLYTINNNYFVCDFKEKDFFFVSDIISLLKV